MRDILSSSITVVSKMLLALRPGILAINKFPSPPARRSPWRADNIQPKAASASSGQRKSWNDTRKPSGHRRYLPVVDSEGCPERLKRHFNQIPGRDCYSAARKTTVFEDGAPRLEFFLTASNPPYSWYGPHRLYLAGPQDNASSAQSCQLNPESTNQASIAVKRLKTQPSFSDSQP